jgi:NAD+ synthase
MNTDIATEILELHSVRPTDEIDFAKEVRDRIDYLKRYIRKTKLKGFVLGISGGVDSSTAGRLCQLACDEIRKEGGDAEFYAVRLPYGVQKDEADAQNALGFIKPDHVITVDIKEATNAVHYQLDSLVTAPAVLDFNKGNVKARIRMVAQYEIAGMRNCLVVGTDHNSELVPAFYTKWGDQACDITVLDGLNKRQVRRMAKELGAPMDLYAKTPTADLEDLKPLNPDETALGFSYDDLDDFLEGKTIDPSALEKIVKQFDKTRHKRNFPVAFSSKEV